MRKAAFTLVLLFFASLSSAQAFQYSSLPSDNLIQNPWFRSSDCKWSKAGWTTTPAISWGLSDKIQDPTDTNCVVGGDAWTGFAARWARNSGGTPEFSPNTPAYIYQIVGPVSPANKTLRFYSLIVAHRVNQYKAEIYGSNSASGPWTSVWTPFDVACTGTGPNEVADCLNEKFGSASNNGDRTGLWDDVTEDVIKLNPLNIVIPGPGGSVRWVERTIPTGFSYYKIEFTMEYPDPDASSTGNVGGKVSRVYFAVSGSAAPTPTPLPGGTSLVEILLKWLKTQLDQNGDGKVNAIDFGLLLQ